MQKICLQINADVSKITKKTLVKKFWDMITMSERWENFKIVEFDNHEYAGGVAGFLVISNFHT